MFQVLKSGGIVMIPIIACGVIATFIIFERWFYYNRCKKNEKKLYKEIKPLIIMRKYDEAIALCGDNSFPAASVLKTMIESRNMAAQDMKDKVFNEATRQIPQLEHLLTSLGTIANISTLLGLLGTVTGNIQAFGVLGEAGSMGNPALLAGAIAEALVTTAAGLIISIPSVIFYNHFSSEANKSISELESQVTDLMLIMEGKDISA
jgi:biopolymer transport protein ExbB